MLDNGTSVQSHHKRVVSHTLCYPMDEQRQILLGRKLTGWQKGYLNGFGGKIMVNESTVNAAVRELQEESTLIAKPDDMKYRGYITFEFPDEFIDINVYMLYKWKGEPQKTIEMDPIWYPRTLVPYEQMKMNEHDHYWLKPMIESDTELIQAHFYFDGDRNLTKLKLQHDFIV